MEQDGRPETGDRKGVEVFSQHFIDLFSIIDLLGSKMV
jgi:hypothetical protein